MPLEKIYREAQEKMHKAVEAADREFSSLRTGRASLHLVDGIEADAYGSKMLLKQMASLSTPDARTILIQPFDKSQMHAIEKAILAANLGLNPSNDGKVIRLIIPPLTEERRKDLVKIAKKMAEDGRVAVRNVRRHANDGIKHIQKDHEITEDEEQKAHKRLQDLTDKYIQEIDDLLERKTGEIMEV